MTSIVPVVVVVAVALVGVVVVVVAVVVMPEYSTRKVLSTALRTVEFEQRCDRFSAVLFSTTVRTLKVEHYIFGRL